MAARVRIRAGDVSQQSGHGLRAGRRLPAFHDAVQLAGTDLGGRAERATRAAESPDGAVPVQIPTERPRGCPTRKLRVFVRSFAISLAETFWPSPADSFAI